MPGTGGRAVGASVAGSGRHRANVTASRRSPAWVVVLLAAACSVVAGCAPAASPSVSPPLIALKAATGIDVGEDGALRLRLTPVAAAVEPGAVLAVEIEGLDRDSSIEVTLDGKPIGIVGREPGRVFVTVPATDPGARRLAARWPGGSAELPLDIAPIRATDGPPGELARRLLDLLAATAEDVAAACPSARACGLAPAAAYSRIVFVIDVSESMTATDIPPSRLDAARGTIRSLLGLLDETASNVGRELGTELPIETALVTFATYPRTASSLGAGTAPAHDALGSLILTEFGTSIGPALTMAAGIAGDAGTLILLSDGEDNSDPATQIGPLDAIRQTVVPAGLTVHTIGLGAPGDATFDEALLRTIADLTGGLYHRASSADELRAAYAALFRDALVGAAVARHRDAVLSAAAANATERLADGLRQIRSGETADAVARAREALATMSDEDLRRLDGVIAASLVLEATERLVVLDAAIGGPSPAPQADLAPCEDIDRRVARTLILGAIELIEGIILPDWYTFTGSVADVVTRQAGALFSDLGGYLNGAASMAAWGQRILAASRMTAACIDAVGSGL